MSGAESLEDMINSKFEELERRLRRHSRNETTPEMMELLASFMQQKAERRRRPRLESISDAPKFTGEGENVAQQLSTWTASMEEWLEEFDFADESEQVRYAAKCLRGLARNWWQTVKRQGERDDNGKLKVPFVSLVDFFHQLRLHFSIGNPATDARHAFYRWKQMGTGRQYVIHMTDCDLLSVKRLSVKIDLRYKEMLS